jgi:hypothetical protein
MNDLPIYRWRDGRLSFTDCELLIVISITVEKNQLPLRISDCWLLITWYQIITNSQGGLPIADYNVSE